MEIKTRLKNKLRKLGVRYVVITTGRVRKGDLGLMRCFNPQKRRWQKVGAFIVGDSVKRLAMQIKRPLNNC